jgi:hypothetical protein
MKVVDITQRREQKQRERDAESVRNTVRAIQDMKDDIMVALNTSIDGLVEAGMDEDKATMVVMAYVSDLIMGHDLGHGLGPESDEG